MRAAWARSQTPEGIPSLQISHMSLQQPATRLPLLLSLISNLATSRVRQKFWRNRVQIVKPPLALYTLTTKVRVILPDVSLRYTIRLPLLGCTIPIPIFLLVCPGDSEVTTFSQETNDLEF